MELISGIRTFCKNKNKKKLRKKNKKKLRKEQEKATEMATCWN